MYFLRLLFFVCVLSTTAAEIIFSPKANIRINWIQQNETQQSINDLLSQANVLIKTSQYLVTGPLKNANASLLLSAKTIKYIAQNFKTDSFKGMLNLTLQQMINMSTNIGKLSANKTTNTSVCYQSTMIKTYNLTQSYLSQISSCAVNKVTTGLVMINNMLAYISTLTNETTVFPINVNICLNSTNSSKNQYTCLKTLLTRMASLMSSAPMTITSMVNNVYEYVNLFPTSLTLCATNTTYSASIGAVGLAVGLSTCVAEKIMGVS